MPAEPTGSRQPFIGGRRGFDNHGYRGSVQSSMLGPGASPGNGWAGARPVGSAAGVIRRRGRMSEAPAEFQVYKRARAFGARRECAFRKTGPILAGYAPRPAVTAAAAKCPSSRGSPSLLALNSPGAMAARSAALVKDALRGAFFPLAPRISLR